MDVMESTTQKSELHSALAEAGVSSIDKVHGAFDAHRLRRERSIARATQAVAGRLIVAGATTRRRRQAWPHLAAACAVVVAITFFGLQTSNDAVQITRTDSLAAQQASLKQGTGDADLEPLVDRLVRRSAQSPEWLVTDADVDQLLGDLEIDI